MSYSIELAGKLRARLFAPRVFRDSKARYDARSVDAEKVARTTWAVHGVCLACRCWAITCGRCANCGIVYGSGANTHANEQRVAVQIAAAKQMVTP